MDWIFAVGHETETLRERKCGNRRNVSSGGGRRMRIGLCWERMIGGGNRVLEIVMGEALLARAVFRDGKPQG